MTCDVTSDEAAMPSLQEMRDKHLAIARYRIYLFDPKKPRGTQKSEIERDLTYDQALAKVDELNSWLRAERARARFMDSSYGFEMTNGWEAMSEYARNRQVALGKGPADFNR